MGEVDLVDGFGEVIEHLKVFTIPLLRSLARGEKLAEQWKVGRGWVAE